MSAFTYDDWLEYAAKYRDYFGQYFWSTKIAKDVHRPVFATPRILEDRSFWGFNDTFYAAAQDWNYAGTPGIVTKRDIITEVFFTELDTVFGGAAAYHPTTVKIPDFSSYHDSLGGVPVTLSATPNRVSDPLFPGKFYYQGFNVDLSPISAVESILDTIIPPGTSFVSLRLAYTTTLIRSPAPNLTWSGVDINSTILQVAGSWVEYDATPVVISFGGDYTQDDGPLFYQRVHNTTTHSVTVYWMLFFT